MKKLFIFVALALTAFCLIFTALFASSVSKTIYPNSVVKISNSHDITGIDIFYMPGMRYFRADFIFHKVIVVQFGSLPDEPFFFNLPLIIPVPQ